MTKTQQRGRAILTTHITIVFTMVAVVIPFYLATRSADFLPSLGLRFALAGGVLAWLYRGSEVARWICIVLFGLGCARSSIAMLGGGDLALIAVNGVVAASYLSFTVVLIASPAVREFLKHQRQVTQVERKMVPVGNVFLLSKHTIVRPLDRLILAFPSAMLAFDELPSAVINCSDAAEITTSDQEGKIYVRLDAGNECWLGKSTQAIVLPWFEGESGPKRVEFCPLLKTAA